MFERKIGLTLLRVIFGIIILKDFLSFYFNRQYLFSNKGIVSYETYLDIINYFHLSWLYINFDIKRNVVAFCILGIFFSLTFLLGVLTKISSIALTIILFIIKSRLIYLMDGADNVISVLMPFFIFLDTKSLITKYENYKCSLKKYLQPYLNITSSCFTLAVMIQICIIYFFASLHKIQSTEWMNGTALYYILNTDDFSASSLNAKLTNSLFLVKFSTWFSMIFQFSFSFLVWFKKTKNIILFIGILFHIGIFVLMRIDNFSLVMLACYAVFFTNNEYNYLINKMKGLLIC